MGWYPKHSGAAGLPVIVAVSLLLAGNTYAQAPDTGPINSPTRPSILLTPEIMRPLVLKVYGRKPELTQQMINPAILNQQLQQHAELVKLYEATDEKAIYRTPNIATQFASVPAQHMLQAAWLQINHSNNYFVSDSINIGGTPLRFVNSKDFQLLDLRKISSSNRYLQAFDTSARQIPGSVIVELKFLGPDIPSLLLPTVTAPQRPGTGELLLAAATKVTFFTAQNQNGAAKDATLQPVHFTQGKLNSLGRNKLDLMLNCDEVEGPVTLFLNVPADDTFKAARQDAVVAYLKTKGLGESDVTFKAGVNAENDYPVARSVVAMNKMSSSAGTAEAIEPGTTGMSGK